MRTPSLWLSQLLHTPNRGQLTRFLHPSLPPLAVGPSRSAGMNTSRQMCSLFVSCNFGTREDARNHTTDCANSFEEILTRLVEPFYLIDCSLWEACLPKNVSHRCLSAILEWEWISAYCSLRLLSSWRKLPASPSVHMLLLSTDSTLFPFNVDGFSFASALCRCSFHGCFRFWPQNCEPSSVDPKISYHGFRSLLAW